MGSVVATVGNKAGKKLVTLAASTSYVFTTIYLPNFATGWSWLEVGFGWQTFSFQYVPGDATVGSVTVNATLDQATAMDNGAGLNLSWDPLPAPAVESGFSWANPMTTNVGQRLFYVKSGPWCAFQVSVSSDYNGTTGYLLMGAAP